jgi:anti-anti-sigma factor
MTDYVANSASADTSASDTGHSVPADGSASITGANYAGASADGNNGSKEDSQGAHTELTGAEHVGSDEHGIGGFAFGDDGSQMPCALSVVSFGDDSRGVPLTLRIHGELDLYTVPFVKGQVHRAVEVLAARDLTLDFTYCDFVDSTGLALVTILKAHLKRSGGRLRVTNLRPTLRRKFDRILKQEDDQ